MVLEIRKEIFLKTVCKEFTSGLFSFFTDDAHVCKNPSLSFSSIGTRRYQTVGFGLVWSLRCIRRSRLVFFKTISRSLTFGCLVNGRAKRCVCGLRTKRESTRRFSTKLL